MMFPEQSEVVKQFLNKSRENLQVAQTCLDNRWYDDCANRAYYSAFQAAIAALLGAGGWVAIQGSVKMYGDTKYCSFKWKITRNKLLDKTDLDWKNKLECRIRNFL